MSARAKPGPWNSDCLRATEVRVEPGPRFVAAGASLRNRKNDEREGCAGRDEAGRFDEPKPGNARMNLRLYDAKGRVIWQAPKE